MDIRQHEFHPGSPPARENLSNEYPLKFKGQKGTIRTKNERLPGGSTSDVRKGVFAPDGSTETTPIAFKVYNTEPLNSAADAPWRIGPAEAGVLSANIPGVAKAYDWGWMHSRADGKYLDGTLNTSNTPIEISPRATLPSQFAIAIEYLDPERYLHPEELWITVRKGLEIDPYTSSTAEGAKRIIELMQPHDLLKKGFVYPSQFAEDLLVSASWMYFNTIIELEKVGWSISDFDLSKNFVFDPDGKQWKLYDFGVATPTNEQAVKFVENLLGEDFNLVITKRKEDIQKAEETRNSISANADQLREASLNGLGLSCLTKAFDYKLPNLGQKGQFRPTGEGLTPKLKEFVDWVYGDESIQSTENIRDRIGEFIVSKMVGSDAQTIIDNTVGQGFNLQRELLKKKSA